MQDFLEQTHPRTFMVMLSALVVLVVALPVTYLLIPQIKLYQSNDTELESLDNAVINSDSLERQLLSIGEEVRILSRQLHGDMAKLPLKQMESFIVARLQKVSWENQIELVAVRPGEGRLVQNFRESLFDVKLVSGYHNFFKWLQMVSDELGYIVVNEFDISPRTTEASDNPQLNISLTLVSYRMVGNER